MSHAPLGEVCEQLGLMDAAQVQRVTARAKETGSPFVHTAREMGLLDDEGAARALAHQYRLNLVPADRMATLRVSPAVLRVLPPDLVRDHRLVPTFLDTERAVLTLLCADPTDVAGLKAAQAAAGAVRLRLFVAARGAIDALITRLLAGGGDEEAPAPGRTVIYEPDHARAAILRQLEAADGSDADVLETVEEVSASVEEARADRIFYRRGLEGVVSALVADWRRIQPNLQLCPLDGYGVGIRPAVRYEAARDFLLAAVERLVAARAGQAGVVRRRVLVERMAGHLQIEPEVLEAAVVLALLHDVDPEPPGPGEDPTASRFSRVGRWFELLDPPWDLAGAIAVLERRLTGHEGPSDDLVVELVFTATTAAGAGIADGADPLLALGADAARHSAEVLDALARALVPEPQLRTAPPVAGLTGRIEDIALAELLQLLTLGGKTALVRVSGGSEVGVVQVRGGRVRGARSRFLEGTEALYSLVAVERGTFDAWFIDQGPINIDTDSEFLILEALRRRDERRGQG